MSFKIVVLRFLLLCIYLLSFGAIMFTIEKNTNQEDDEKKFAFETLWKKMNSSYNMTRKEFENFTEIAYWSLQPAKLKWTFQSGINFAFISCTTIGYGAITPTTDPGKIACIFGALIGIPLTLLTLNLMGSMMNSGFIKLIQHIESRLFGRKCFKYIKLKCLACSLVAMTLTFLIGTLYIVHVSTWSYVNTIYYLFITWSTIGFGDNRIADEKVISKFNNEEKMLIKSLALIYNLFGLAVVACVINSAVEVTQSLKCTSVTINNVKPSRRVEKTVAQCLQCGSLRVESVAKSRNEDDCSVGEVT